jgi:ornithine carbamoyltransferase
MPTTFKGRDMITLQDYSGEEIWRILHTARELKNREKIGDMPRVLEGKVVALIFENRSTRTRASFEAGVAKLRGHPMYIWMETAQVARGEPPKDAVRVWTRYADAIVLRALEPFEGHKRLLEYAELADVPVINASTDLHHPCQALADFMTIWEKKGRLAGLKLAYSGIVGHGAGTSNEFLVACPKLGMDLAIGVPKGYAMMSPQVIGWAQENAREFGTEITISHDICEAVENADVVYTDEWASTGFFEERESRRAAYEGFTITNEVMKHARADAIYMHCLPAVRGEEVADEVLEGPQSVIWDEAENRLHVQTAVMALLIP